MYSRVQRTAAVLVMCWAATATAAASAVSNFNTAGEHAFAAAYGEALPPVGYVDFCARHAAECRPVGGIKAKVELTPERWKVLGEINSFVNRKVRPAHDADLYGMAEYWTIPTDAGDCEDYVLLKKRYLEGLGFPAETLLITVVIEEEGGGHAVLTVRTSVGDLVLDNRRDDILRWADTGYHLVEKPPVASVVIAWLTASKKDIPAAA